MSTQPPRQRSFVEKRQGDTLFNALLGAVASFALSFTGVGMILGGAISGYLQNEGQGTGAKVGAIAGFLAAIPVFFVIWLVLGGIGMFGIGIGEMGFGALFGGIALFFMLFVFAISVGMGALGGFIGGAVADDRRPRNEGRVEEQWREER